MERMPNLIIKQQFNRNLKLKNRENWKKGPAIPTRNTTFFSVLETIVQNKNSTKVPTNQLKHDGKRMFTLHKSPHNSC